MTPHKYMKKMLRKHTLNLKTQTERNAPTKVLKDIENKIKCYEAAVAALEKEIEK